MKLGTVTNFDDSATVRHERLVAAPVSPVWSALTDASRLSAWLAPTTIDLVTGGAVHIDFGEDQQVDGVITECEPQRVLEYTWSFADETGSVLRLELTPADTATALVLEHRLLPPDQSIGYGAGWHAHLDVLISHLSGGPQVDWDERFEELYPLYAGA